MSPEHDIAREPDAEAVPVPRADSAGDGEPEVGAAAQAEAGAAPDGVDGGSVEDLVAALEQVTGERDEYLALARERQAEFENYRKQMVRRQTEHLEQAASALVEKLLPVLDAFDSGVAHGQDQLVPLHSQLLGVLEKEGLERLAPEGEPFDPSEQEAVMHEPAEGDSDGEVVVEVLRTGYRWKGRVLRPAMVRVRG